MRIFGFKDCILVLCVIRELLCISGQGKSYNSIVLWLCVLGSAVDQDDIVLSTSWAFMTLSSLNSCGRPKVT